MKNRVYKILLCAAEIMASVVISFNAGSVRVLAEDTAQTRASDTQNAGQDGNTPPDAPTDGTTVINGGTIDNGFRWQYSFYNRCGWNRIC